MAGSNVWVKCGKVYNLLSEAPPVTTTVTGTWVYKDSAWAAIQCVVSGTGAVSATVVLEVSNDGVNAVATPLATITLSGTTAASDGITTMAPWKFIRARVTAISGTGAVVTVPMSV